MSRKRLYALVVLGCFAGCAFLFIQWVWENGTETLVPTWGTREPRAQTTLAPDSEEPLETLEEATTVVSAAPAIPSLRAEAAAVQKLAAARDFAAAESWDEVAQAVQGLLDGPPDALVPVTRVGKDGQQTTAWAGLRAEAARVLGTLPAGGREFYETVYGNRARLLLAEARKDGDVRLLAQVARRFPHTAAGTEALRLLGVHHLDRGRNALAAVCFARLIDRPDADALPPAVLVQAALAFRRTGDEEWAGRAWDRLAAKASGPLRLGGQTVGLAELKKELDGGAVAGPAAPARGPAEAAGLEARWTRPTVSSPTARDWLKEAAPDGNNSDQPVLPAFVPVRAGDRLFYRSYRGVHALDLRTGRDAWQTASAWGMEALVAEPRYEMYLQQWVNAYLRNNSSHVLYSHAPLGTVSTDGRRVYAVDDLAVPPYRENYRTGGRWRQEPPWPDFGPGLTEAAYCNRLLALDAASGQLAWAVGGRDAGRLGDRYFLGPPLPLDGRLYGLTEKDNLLALNCLDAADGRPLWQQPLAYAPSRLLLDPGRHIQAASPVYGHGVLVCPTNTGVVLGIDLLTPGLAWAYPYRSRTLTYSRATAGGRRPRISPPQVVAEWKSPVTLIDQDRVLFTAPDEASIHCLNLRDGTLVWRRDRDRDDLYLAGVVAGHALVVGNHGCRALALEDGQQRWRVETGVPTGRGAAAGDRYYLPVRAAGSKKQPTIVVIDARRGTVLARVRVAGKQAPGNLVVCGDEILSQSVTALTAYRAKKAAKK